MAFVESWVESDPDGSVITGSLLDDYQRQTKRALRERLEGDPANPLTGIFETGSWALAPIPRAGTARMYYGTDAAMLALAAASRQDGRLAFSTDLGVLYHAATAGMVPIGGSRISKADSTSPSFLVIDSDATYVGAIFPAAGESIVVQSHNTNAKFAAVSFAAPAQFLGYRANTSSAAPSQVVNGSTLLSIQGRGYTSAPGWTTSGSAGIELIGAEAWTGAAQGSYISMFTTPLGSTATADSLIIRPTSIAIPATNRLYFDGTAAGGDTYILENAANSVLLWVGGAQALLATTTTVSLGTQDFTVNATKKLYIDGGGDTYIYESVANRMVLVTGAIQALAMDPTNVWINPLTKFWLDGFGDTYLVESAANQIDFYTGGVLNLRMSTTQAIFSNKDVILDATKRLFLDGGSDTYAYEVAANAFAIVAGGARSAFGIASGWVVDPIQRIYLDGGGDTYIFEVSANLVHFYAGGVNVFAYNATNVGANVDFNIPPTKKFFLDGAGDTYLYEVSANRIDMVVGGVNLWNFLTTITATSQDLALNATKRLYLDGGSDTYILEAAANDLRFIVGTATSLRLTAGAAVIPATNLFYLDGAGDTYIYENAANSVLLIVGAAQSFRTTTALFELGSGLDFILSTTKRLYLDGGGDTYLYEPSANRLDAIVGGTVSSITTATYFAIPATNKLYFDGVGDTYIHESAGNILQIVVGGTVAGEFRSTQVSLLGVATFTTATSQMVIFDTGAVRELRADAINTAGAGFRNLRVAN